MARTVFGIVDLQKRDEHPTMANVEELLLRKQPDGYWFLPGCIIPDEAHDAEALPAAILEQTGLNVRLANRFHVDYASGDDHAVLYGCSWLRPKLIPTLRTGSFMPFAEFEIRRSVRMLLQDGNRVADVPVLLPLKQYPHLCQLILDACVLQGTPLQLLMDEEPEITKPGIHVCRDGKSLIGIFPMDRLMWSRIVPAKA